MLKFLFFIIPCFLWIIRIIDILFNYNYDNFIILEKKLRRDFRKQFLHDSWKPIIVTICIFLSYDFIEFKLIWVILAILNLFGILFVFFFKSINLVSNRIKTIYPSMQDMDKYVTKKKIHDISYKIFVLMFWIYSWRHVLFHTTF